MHRLIFAAATAALATAAIAQADDPYLWLEEIEGDRAVTQVKQWNAATEATLAATIADRDTTVLDKRTGAWKC